MNEERLNSFQSKGIQNWCSKGMYDYQDLHFHNIENDALLILEKDGEEIERHQYRPVYKNTVQFKNTEGKNSSITYTIRKSTYSDCYHFSSDNSSVLFDDKEHLDKYLLERFGIHILNDREV